MRFIYAETCSGVGGTARGDEEESVRGGGGGGGRGSGFRGAQRRATCLPVRPVIQSSFALISCCCSLPTHASVVLPCASVQRLRFCFFFLF